MQTNLKPASGSALRTTVIYALFTLLIILWTLQPLGLRPANCISAIGEKPATCVWRVAAELPLWLLVLGLVLWNICKSGKGKLFLKAWTRLWLVVPFLLLTVISTTWSAAPLVTLERTLILIAATITIVYLLQDKNPNEVSNLLAGFFAILIAASYLLIFLFPSVGRMLNPPYNGAWDGIFWHRNYLGAFMAFGSTVYLFRLLFLQNKGAFTKLISIAGIAASTVLVLGSHSGAGILTLATLTALTLVIFLWAKVRNRMRPWHYWATGAAAIILAVAVLTNLDFVFGLVNRNTSLTGRIPLWQLLYQEYVSTRLLFGYGMNAIWAFESVRTGLQSALGWGYPVLIGDNGMVDILLHLGVAGAILMLALILYAFYRSGKYAITVKTGMAFLPLIGMVFVVMGNISLSMLLELEYFVWVLILFTILVDFDSSSEKTEIEKPS